MPTLFDRIFGEPQKLADRKSQFAEMIERGLRVGRGETFEEPLEGFSVLQNKPVGGKPGIVKFDQPEDKDRPLHHSVGEEAFKEFLKRITGASEKATNKFKERMGIADLGGPQYLVEPQFEENLERTLIEEIAGFAGEFAPQIIGGAVLQAGLLPGAAAGVAEEILAGGDEEDILFSALGGGLGGLLGKIGKGLGEEGLRKLDPIGLREELTAIQKAVDTGVDHVVPHPDFDFFAQIDPGKVNTSVFRKLAQELGVPQTTITANIAEAGGDGAKLTSALDEFFELGAKGEALPDVFNPTIINKFGSVEEIPPVLSPRLQALVDQRKAGILPGTPPPIDPTSVRSRVLKSAFDPKAFKKYDLTPREGILLREAQIVETVRQYDLGIKSTSPVEKFGVFGGHNRPLLKKADTILSKWLEPIVGRKGARKVLKDMTSVQRYQLVRELESSKILPTAPSEVIASARNVLKNTMKGTNLSQLELNTVVNNMNPNMVMKLAKEADSAAGRSTQKITAAVCQALARGSK